jgi:hypothetical protein
MPILLGDTDIDRKIARDRFAHDVMGHRSALEQIEAIDLQQLLSGRNAERGRDLRRWLGAPWRIR